MQTNGRLTSFTKSDFPVSTLARLTYSPALNSPNLGAIVAILGYDSRPTNLIQIVKADSTCLIGLENVPGGIAYARPEWLEPVTTEEYHESRKKHP